MMFVSSTLLILNLLSSSLGLLHFNNIIHNDFQRESRMPLLPPEHRFSKKFEQILDHFNPADTRTWEQSYRSAESYYESGGPVYLYLWDNSPISYAWARGSYWFSHATEHKAMIFILEHRFFNKNQPLRDASTKNLQYIHSAQALADVASFITGINEEYKFPSGTKWIVFGGSYSGNLAAWSRLRYPHLVYGAVASSAFMQAQLEIPGYLETVGRVLGDFKSNCKDDMAEANKKLDELSETVSGRQEIGKIFRLCSPLHSGAANISFFMSTMTTYVSEVVQYDKRGEGVKNICNIMLENSAKLSPIDRYAKVIHTLMRNKNEGCLPTKFEAYVASLKRHYSSYPTNNNRALLYLTCTELGITETSHPSKSIFSKKVDLNYFVSLCKNVFKKSFDKNFISAKVKSTNIAYGGSDVDISRVVFVQGTDDPYASVQVTPSKKKSFEVISIKGGSHCSDLQIPTQQDSDDLKAARTKITKILEQWIE